MEEMVTLKNVQAFLKLFKYEWNFEYKKCFDATEKLVAKKFSDISNEDYKWFKILCVKINGRETDIECYITDNKFYIRSVKSKGDITSQKFLKMQQNIGESF